MSKELERKKLQVRARNKKKLKMNKKLALKNQKTRIKIPKKQEMRVQAPGKMILKKTQRELGIGKLLSKQVLQNVT